jgi:Flp pilus assembly protein TadG
VPAPPADALHPEAGSTLPFVLVCWLVGALMVFGAIAASDAFLEQQQVQSVCDGAALAAADQADEALVYAHGVGAHLPLSRSVAETAVADQLTDAGVSLDAWSAQTDGAEVTVRCTRSVHIAFDWLFLGGNPLERTAVASARAPTTG